MTEKTKENYSIIENLVEKYFGLEDKSFIRFKETLRNPFVDESFKGVDEDLRLSIPFDSTNIAALDKGWEMFQEYFSVFVKENGIDYESFRNNLFKRGKSKLRLFKNLTEDLTAGFKDKSAGVKQFYKQYYGRYSPMSVAGEQENFVKRLNEVLNRIGTMKIPSSTGLKFVVSLNFADWFLCSSGETWRSCLGLDSEYDSCYWSGLPGTVVDKNRALFYITDGAEKEYKGIKTEHIISRSWILLGSNNEMRWLRFYPNEIVNSKNAKILLAGTQFAEMKEIKSREAFKSKHSVDLLRYSSGITSFIFQDSSTFIKEKDGSVYIIGESNGFRGFDLAGHEVDYNMLNSGASLDILINNNESISNYFEASTICDSCGSRVDEDDTIYYNDNNYCSECFNKQFYSCNNCGKIVPYTDDEDSQMHSLCEKCYSEKYSECVHCGTEVKKSKGKEDKKKWTCSKCAKKNKEEEVA